VHQFLGRYVSVDKYCTDAIVEGWTAVEENWNSDELSDNV